MEKFIIWDPRDGEPQRDQGKIISDGITGRLDRLNVYIKTYAAYEPETPMNINGGPELEVGEFAVAKFNLSGSSGIYRVYRVE